MGIIQNNTESYNNIMGTNIIQGLSQHGIAEGENRTLSFYFYAIEEQGHSPENLNKIYTHLTKKGYECRISDFEGGQSCIADKEFILDEKSLNSLGTEFMDLASVHNCSFDGWEDKTFIDDYFQKITLTQLVIASLKVFTRRIWNLFKR